MNNNDILIEQLHTILQHDHQLMHDYIYYHNINTISNYLLLMSIIIFLITSIIMIRNNHKNTVLEQVKNKNKILLVMSYNIIMISMIFTSYHLIFDHKIQQSENALHEQLINRNINEDYFHYKLDKNNITLEDTQFELLDQYDNKVSDFKIIDYRDVAKFNWFINVLSEDKDHYIIKNNDPLDMVNNNIIKVDKKEFYDNKVLEYD